MAIISLDLAYCLSGFSSSPFLLAFFTTGCLCPSSSLLPLTSCLAILWHSIRLLPHLGFSLSRLSDTSLRILPHCFSSLYNFSASCASLLSFTFNQSCLAQIQTSSQPICLILTLQCYVRLLAQTHFPDITHSIAHNSLQ
jgi:hypothetical protein